MLRRLVLNPGFHTDPAHFFQIPDDVFMVADPIDDVLFTEFMYPVTGKRRAFMAAAHPMSLGTGPETGDALLAPGSDFVRQAAVAILRITGAGTAEQAADTGTFFIGNSLHISSPFPLLITAYHSTTAVSNICHRK